MRKIPIACFKLTLPYKNMKLLNIPTTHQTHHLDFRAQKVTGKLAILVSEKLGCMCM